MLDPQILPLIIDNISDLLLILKIGENPKYLIQETNKAFLETTTLKREQIIGIPLQKIFPQDQFENILQKLENAITGKANIIFQELFHLANGQGPFSGKLIPICDSENICTNLLLIANTPTASTTNNVDLKDKVHELEKISELMVGRELKMKALKDEIRKLKKLLKESNDQDFN